MVKVNSDELEFVLSQALNWYEKGEADGGWVLKAKEILAHLGDEIVKEGDCGCVVLKREREKRLPLFFIRGQGEGITENPLAAGGNNDSYMASLSLQSCPHRANSHAHQQ